MTFRFSQASLDKLHGIHPDLVRVAQLAIETSPVDFKIVQGVRTQEYQNALYAQGRTAPGPIVTWTRKSRHIGGFAIDVAAWIDGKIDWDAKHYGPITDNFRVASRLLNVPIVLGIDWKKKPDLGHIELDGNFYPGVIG